MEMALIEPLELPLTKIPVLTSNRPLLSLKSHAYGELSLLAL
jgi:hypothetical protein